MQSLKKKLKHMAARRNCSSKMYFITSSSIAVFRVWWLCEITQHGVTMDKNSTLLT